MRRHSIQPIALWWQVLAAALLCLTSVTAVSAQHRRFLDRLRGSEQRPGAHGGVESEQRWDVAVTFSAQRSKTVTGTDGTFLMTGIGGNVYYNAFHGLGPVADLYFLRAANIAPHIDLSEYTYLGGLRYTLGTGSPSRAPKRLQVFAEGLGGRVQAFNSLFPGSSGSGVVKNATNLAIEGGAGVDWRVGRKIGFRVIQADFVQTYLPNGQLNIQRDVRVSSGFSAHF
ncbi:hypothetical protein [Terriglobus sp.]|uniref:hypothetical protein n=1 Tax=Terriglobus sp. TaxID=1889013 RepID=UPI003AFF7D29